MLKLIMAQDLLRISPGLGYNAVLIRQPQDVWFYRNILLNYIFSVFVLTKKKKDRKLRRCDASFFCFACSCSTVISGLSSISV